MQNLFRLLALAATALLFSCRTLPSQSEMPESGAADPAPANPHVQHILAVNQRLDRARELIKKDRLVEAEQELADLQSQPYFRKEIDLLTEDIARRRYRPNLVRRQDLSQEKALAEVDERLVLPPTYGQTRIISPQSLPDAFPTGAMDELISRRFDFDVENADIRTLIVALSQLNGLNIVADESLSSESTLTIKVKNTPLQELLSYISRNMGIAFHLGQNVIWVTSADDQEEPGPLLDTLVYRLRSGYVPAIDNQNQGGDGGLGGFSELGGDLGNAVTQLQGGISQDDLLTSLTDFLDSVPDRPQNALFKVYRNRNLLVIRDTHQNLRVAEQIIRAFDKAPVQVAIEARFLTIGQNDLLQLGTTIDNIHYEQDNKKSMELDFASQLPAFGTAIANPGRLGLAGVIDRVTYSAVTEALKQLRSSRNLSAPRVTVINNQPARLRRGEKRYYFDEYDIESSGGENPVIATIPSGEAEELETGITLEVRPSVGNDLSTIALAVSAQIIEFIEFQALSEDITMPVTDENSVNTTVLVNSGQTVVLGGMLSAQDNESESKVPLLGDIPGVGYLFKKKENIDSPTHLLIFLTATILDPDGRFNTVAPRPLGP